MAVIILIVLGIFAQDIFSGIKKGTLKIFCALILLFLAFFIVHGSIFTNLMSRLENFHVFANGGITEFVRMDQSASERRDKWSLVWDSFLSYPVLGIGVGGFSNYFIGADGQHIQTLGETGLVGLVLFLAMFFFIINMNQNSIRYLKRLPLSLEAEVDKTFLADLSIGILGLLLDGFAINIFDSSKVAMCLWAFVGVAAKLNSMYKCQ